MPLAIKKSTRKGMMSSSSTPIRAITTPLRSPTPAPIPSSDKLYEPHAKAVLRRRLTNRVFVYTALVSLASGFYWSGLEWGVGAAVIVWLGGFLPIILLKKTHLTVSHTSAPSPALLLQRSFAPPLRIRTANALQAHLISALAILALHTTLDNNRIPVFIKSRKHPYTLHPVLMLFALNQSVVACLCVLRAVMRDVWVFPFKRPALLPSPGTLLAPIVISLVTLPISLTLVFVVIPILRRIPILSLVFTFTRTPHLSVLKHVPRALTVSILTTALWEMTAAIWESVLSEELGTTPAIRTLVSGISISSTPAPTSAPTSSYPGTGSSVFSTPARSSSSPFASQVSSVEQDAPAPIPETKPVTVYTHLAYAELHKIAMALSETPSVDAKAATELFDVDGLVWSTLARETLILLGNEYQVLLGRGVAPSPPPPPSKVPATGFSTPVPATPTVGSTTASTSRITQTPLIKQNIFAPKSVPSSPAARVGAALASGETVEGIVGPVVDGLPLPDINLTAQLKGYVPKIDVQKHLRLPGWLSRLVSVSLPKAWTRPRMGRTVREWVPRSEVCIEAVEVLTHLTSVSLTADRFGVAQRDIPRILEALLAFLTAVESAQAELRAKLEDSNISFEEKDDVEAAGGVVGDLGDALKDGIARIVRTFGDKLRAFKFPPRTASRLQEFVDYSHGAVIG
ncbi:hypothetical protein MIND_00619300 [Mycena indigotica]|uniref:Nucleoporin protein Ndc1-Nup n=1 Tax=Mycena indigotica TaxID=2126181 RepID=A0A8H6SS55_9AGAR|nr:uncharacterized protein MIND_00619300 [Mycena indigotica]KAF7303892.1 hypothetical protein MIND_00619300 [Mycena indigotica]